MAHIPDGVLSTPVLATGALLCVGMLAVSLRRLDEEHLPQAAVLSAAFFVSSLVSVPVGVGSVHLLLNGLMGLLLGWSAVPALFVALLLQAVFFGFGGLVVLGVNTANMALPALVCALLLRPMLASVAETPGAPGARRAFWLGAAAGGLGVALTALLVAVSLSASGRVFVPAAQLLLVTYLPLLLVETLISGSVTAFLHRVEPSLLRVANDRA